MRSAPFAVWLLDKVGCLPPPLSHARLTFFRRLVFALTFVTYTAFHCSRKPISVVKNVLNQNCSGLLPPPHVNASGNPHWCDWQPFVGENSNTLLGVLDSSYLFSYAFFMYFSGMLAERMDLRYFLSLAMLGSALLTWAFGVAFYWDIHSLSYFICVQVACGVFQAGGWPGVVAVMAYWQDNTKRGLIFGLWNSHTSLGNILGTLIASAFVSYNWGLSFIVPGLLIAATGVVNYLLLTPYPGDVECASPVSSPGRGDVSNDLAGAPPGGDPDNFSDSDETRSLLVSTEPSINQCEGADTCSEQVAEEVPSDNSRERVVSFLQALKIPGVVPFSLSLFFAKLVSYTFLYWLPRYLHSAAGYDATKSANLSTMFDLGGIAGAVLAGLLSDRSRAPAIVCFCLLLTAIPVIYTMQFVAGWLLYVQLVAVGVLVNGPYALITTAVAADLGESHVDSQAMATVAAIIDGTGSVGAAIGPLLAGAVSSGNRWSRVFTMLMAANALAILCLVSLIRKEWRQLRR